MLKIPDCPEPLREELFRLHTHKNPAYETVARFSPWGPPKNVPKVLEFAVETQDSLLVPRGTPTHRLSSAARTQWDRLRWQSVQVSAPARFPLPLLKPNSEQRLLLASFEESREDRTRPFGNYLFVAPTSAGKTVLQALAARETGQRTLVLCLTNLIKKAWLDDLYALYGLSQKDIGLIQQDTWRIGEQFTLASVATIGRREERWAELFQQFGCVVLDEADTCTSPTVFKFMRNCPARFLVGATATDRLDEGANVWLDALFGPAVRRVLSKQKDTESSYSLRGVDVIPTAFQYEYDPANLDWNDLSDMLSVDEDRNQLIAHHAYRQWKAGRSLLVVTKRVAHAGLLLDVLKEAGIEDANLLTGETNSDRRYSELLVKGVIDRSIRCVVATAQAVKRGANLNALDRLHLAMPLASERDLEQLIGRIRRRGSGKVDCRMTYYLDSQVRYLHNLYKRKAMAVFRKLKTPGFVDLYSA